MGSESVPRVEPLKGVAETYAGRPDPGTFSHRTLHLNTFGCLPCLTQQGFGFEVVGDEVEVAVACRRMKSFSIPTRYNQCLPDMQS